MSKAAPKTCQASPSVCPYSYMQTHTHTHICTLTARTSMQPRACQHIQHVKASTQTHTVESFKELINEERLNIIAFFPSTLLKNRTRSRSFFPLFLTHTNTFFEPQEWLMSLHFIFSFLSSLTQNTPRSPHLFLRHAVQLRMPGGGVRAVIGGGRGKILQYDWVSLLTQWGQVTDVQLQLTAILIKIQERRKNLKEENRKCILLCVYCMKNSKTKNMNDNNNDFARILGQMDMQWWANGKMSKTKKMKQRHTERKPEKALLIMRISALFLIAYCHSCSWDWKKTLMGSFQPRKPFKVVHLKKNNVLSFHKHCTYSSWSTVSTKVIVVYGNKTKN